MNAKFLVGALVSALAAPALGAQGLPAEYTAKCPFGTQQERVTQDACVKAIDLFKYLAPQLATTIAAQRAEQLDQLRDRLASEGRFMVSIESASSRGDQVEGRIHLRSGAR
jgi:hypothetical protein